MEGISYSLGVRIREWENIYQTEGKRYGDRPSAFCELTNRHLIDSKKVLELGCGYGRDLLHLAELYPRTHFVGVDSSLTAISVLLQDIKKKRLRNLDAITGNWLDLPSGELESKGTDAIISHFFLHLFLEWERKEILRRSAEVLAPGSLFIASLVSVNDKKFAVGRQIEEGTFACYLERPWHFLHFWRRDEIERIFHLVGFKLEYIFEYMEKEEILNQVEDTCAWFVASRKLK